MLCNVRTVLKYALVSHPVRPDHLNTAAKIYAYPILSLCNLTDAFYLEEDGMNF